MSTFITAIEIGSSKIKGAVGVVDDNRSLNILAIEEVPLNPGSVRYGCVVNVEEVGAGIARIKRLLENNPRVSPRKIIGAYVALGGRSMASHLTEASASLNPDTEITENIMVSLRNQVRSEKISSKEILDTVPVSYMVDGKTVGQPVGMLGSQVRARYNLVVSDEKNQNNLKRAFERGNLKLFGGISRILAEDALLLTRDQRKLGTLIVDFGAETTTVAIYKDNALRFLQTIPLGSHLISRDLASILNISDERAEELKINHVNLSKKLNEEDSKGPEKTLDNINYTLINNIAQARASEIIANVQHQLEDAGFKTEDLTEGVIVIGKGARLNGFKELLQKNMNMKIARPASVENIEYSYNLNVPFSESLDVVAVLAVVARNPRVTDCTELPVIEKPQPAEALAVEEKQTIAKDEKKQKKNNWKTKYTNFLNILSSEDEDFDDDNKYDEE